MSKTVKQDKFIFSDIKANNNKFWTITLYDDGKVITEYGRVGFSGQTSDFPNAGASFYDKKIKEKTKKGYTPLRTIDSGSATSQAVASNDLRSIVARQVARDKPELHGLIDRIVKANIHNIVNSTNISYNASTGLFSTPLGIVTLDGIQEARDLLALIKKLITGRSNATQLVESVNTYMRIIPQNIGMRRVTPRDIFPDDASILRQNDILDSLESSFNAVTQKSSTPNQVSEPKLFEVEFDILTDDRERKRLEAYYHSSMRDMHGYKGVKIKEMYAVKILEMEENFHKLNKQNVQEVYHGTSQSNLLSIFKSGIKLSPPSSTYISGKMFGHGIYGAIQSSKSLGYTFGKWGGSRGDAGWLFVCDFNMGQIHEPTRTVSRPPTGCDSIWAKASKCGLAHDELIVYNDARVNVKYLLECK